jgi:hypothetical protein
LERQAIVEADFCDVEGQFVSPLFVGQGSGHDEEINVRMRMSGSPRPAAEEDNGNQAFAKRVVSFI